MQSIHSLLIGYLTLINGVAYILMWLDKYRSKKAGRRIKETNLFLMALILGAAGIYIGMKYPIYHKAAKPSFKFGIPLLIVLNLVCICMVMKYV